MVGHGWTDVIQSESITIDYTTSRTYEVLEKGQVGDHPEPSYCDLFLSILIVVNLIAVCLETIDSLFAQ